MPLNRKRSYVPISLSPSLSLFLFVYSHSWSFTHSFSLSLSHTLHSLVRSLRKCNKVVAVCEEGRSERANRVAISKNCSSGLATQHSNVYEITSNRDKKSLGGSHLTRWKRWKRLLEGVVVSQLRSFHVPLFVPPTFSQLLESTCPSHSFLSPLTLFLFLLWAFIGRERASFIGSFFSLSLSLFSFVSSLSVGQKGMGGERVARLGGGVGDLMERFKRRVKYMCRC